MSEHNDNAPYSFSRKIWNVFFILLYPVLVTFSLLFTGILLVFSGLSKLLFKLIQLFSPKPEDTKLSSRVKSATPPHSVNS